MRVKPLRKDLIRYLTKRGLTKKFAKQIKIFSTNPRRRSLNVELLEPKKLKIYSFRINRKYRAIFIMIDSKEAEIIDINDHYQ